LAKRSALRIYCLEPDLQKVIAARQALDAVGVYGVRVTVHQGSLSELPYADYFANLIVLEEALVGDFRSCSASELWRVLRPCGGTAYLAAAGVASVPEIGWWLRGAGLPAAEIRTSETAVQVVRGELPGAGEWTHQYADARRSGSSEDQLVKLPLKLLWFGKPGPAKMINRHWRGPAPLSTQGRLFAIGQHSITAVDAYNGRELWCQDLPGAGRFPVDQKGSNAVADRDSVYIATGDVCLRFNAATGETRQTYHAPPPPESLSAESPESLTWEYLAQKDDLVFGSIGSEAEGQYVFALGKDSGEPRWLYTAEGVVSNNAITVGAGRVYMLDRTSAQKIDQLKRRGEPAVAKATLLALDAATGETIWRTDRGLTKRTELRLARDVLVATGGGRMTAYSVHNGRMLSWSGVEMRRFPVIVGDTIYGEPYAYDLRTGEPKQRVHPLTGDQVPWSFRRSYGCGSVSGAPTMLLFRSGTVGFCDLAGDSGIHNFGGVRAGCYVNAIAANGLVLMPPGDAGCTCSYNYQTTVAFVPTTRNEEWSVFSAEGVAPGTKIRQLAVNFGALGDQRDRDGKLWLAVPRPGGLGLIIQTVISSLEGFPGPAGLGVPVAAQFSSQGQYYRHNADELMLQGTDSPWLYASGGRGLVATTVNLGSPEPKAYTIRLHFAELADLEAGQRVFDVKLQDEVVLEGLDVVKETGASNTALVKEFSNIRAADTIKLELVPRTDREPIISAIEIYEE